MNIFYNHYLMHVIIKNLYAHPINIHIDFKKTAIIAVTSILCEHVNIK